MNTVVSPCRRPRRGGCKRYPSLFALAAMVGALSLPTAPQARQNSVQGALSLGNTYDSNVFRSDKVREDEWKSLVAPQLSFASKGLTDNLSLTYAPTYSYNHRRQDDEQTQALSFQGDKGLSSRWKVTMSGNYAAVDNLFFEADTNLGVTQNFLRADSATQAEIVRILFPELVWDPVRDMGAVISQLQSRYDAFPAAQGTVRALLFQGADGARQQYWNSQVLLSSVYEFAEKSSLVLGYRLTSLDNKTGIVADRLGHSPSALLTYQFNQQWKAALGYDLSFDAYDTTPDSTTNHPHLQVDYQLSPKNLLFWNYDYQKVTYDGVSNDTTSQGSHIGWNYGFDPRTSFTTTVGTTYLGREVGPDEREYTLDLGVTRTMDRGSVGLRAHGMKAVASVADSWDKSRQSWELSSDLTYQLLRDLSSTGRVSYGQWDSWGIAGLSTSPYDRLQLGAGVRYLFKQWFTLSLNYDYNLFDTESAILDDYTEHLITLNLAGAKELWRW